MTIPLDRELKSLRAHLAARRFADAENACRAILNSHPDDADALHLFGIVALSTERYDEAIERLRAAIQRRPDSPEFQNTLGEAFRRSGRIHDAVTSYQAALALRPQYVPALNNLALALLSQGDFAGAAQAAQCAAEHQPANARAFYLLGTALEKLGQLEEAIRALARAVHIRPNYPAALKQLGELLRRFPISSDCVQELLPYDRNDPQGIEQFGRLMVALERPEDAEEALRQTLCRRPNDAAVALDLALALDRQGRAPEAIEQYQRAHALTGDDVFRVVAATRMPIIYQSNDEIRQWRQRLHDQIDGLRRARLRIDLERKTVPPLFFSAYQGFNDCDLLRDYARLLPTTRSRNC